MILLFLFLIVNSFSETELILLDSVAVLCVGSSGISPVYYSDNWFSNPFSGVKTLSSVIIDAIWLSYGSEHGIKMNSDGASSEYAEQYFDMIQDKKGISKKKIASMVEEYGSNLEDIRKFLNNQYLIQQTIETFFAASGKLNVCHEDILQYYNTFPFYQDDIYFLQCGVMQSDKDEYNKEDLMLCHKKIVWDIPYEIAKKDLNDSFKNIDNEDLNSIIYYEYDSEKNQYLIYKYVKKIDGKLLSINDCYEDITKILQSMQYEESYKKMTMQLLCSDKIIYSDLKIKSDAIDFLNIDILNHV